MFHRDTGFDTAYVGSSNLSTSRTARRRRVECSPVAGGYAGAAGEVPCDVRHLLEQPEFETYDPDRDRDRLDDALAEASGRRASDRVTISLSGLEVRPYPYQQEMLDALDAERIVHDRHRNLVVAATGTGKTVIAALDYRRCATGRGQQPRLLFVAHRKEILEQSLRTYREVLGDATSASSTSAVHVQNDGGTSSPASSR